MALILFYIEVYNMHTYLHIILLPLALHFCLWRREQNNPPITKTLYTNKRNEKKTRYEMQSDKR